MGQPSVNRRGNRAKGIPDTWECRYFVDVSKLPHEFEHDRLRKEKRFFDQWEGPHHENDVYLVTADLDVNVKLRKPEELQPSVKLRVCCRHEPDGFELWRTEIDHGLPAPAEVWREVLAALKVVEDNAQELSSLSEPGQVTNELSKAEAILSCTEMQKDRWRYSGPQGDVEVARVTAPSLDYYSVSFESIDPDPAGIRAIRAALPTDNLGPPTNYVQLLSRISPR